MPKFITQIDASPVVWQFLQSLRTDDLAVELVQNELDASSLETHLTFANDQFICEGIGEAIDEDGWKRLPFFLGAGDQAPRKRGKTGVKNHGLKSCFTLGDYIRLRSAGKMFEQTLYRDGETKPPHPGSYEKPIPDDSAPRVGCRIEVPYRRTKLVTKEGEEFNFGPIQDQELERLFTRLVADAPQRFLGVVRPGFRDNYKLTVTHWKLGTVTFHFTSRRIRQKSKTLLFARECQITTTTPESTVTETRRERAFAFRLRLSRQELGEVPEYYAWYGGACAEVCWTVDARGQPLSDLGVCRYPLAYPADITSGRTDLGVFYSAPFKSDSVRHGLGDGSRDFNEALIENCHRQLTAILRTDLMPRFGPSALSIVCSPLEPASSRAVQVLGNLVAAGAIPVVGQLGSRRQKRISKQIAGYHENRSPAPKKYSFIIPAEGGRPSTVLAAANRTGFPALDPRTPTTIVSMLLSQTCVGRGQSYVSFDAEDIVNRLLRIENSRFSVPTESELTVELSKVKTALAYLDVLLLLETVPRGKEWGKQRTELLQRLLLPDANGALQPLSGLYRALHVPLDLPGIKAPAIIHPDLAKHPLLARPAWRRDKLDFASYLDDLNLEQNPEHRLPFWNWLRSRPDAIPNKLWSRLKRLPIWPDKARRQLPFAELCRLADPYLRRVMIDIVKAPHPQAEILARDVGTLGKLRSELTFEEMEAWYSARLQALPRDQLSTSEIDRFRQIEVTLLRLVEKPATRKHVKRLGVSMMALSKDGSLRPPSALHAQTPALQRLKLLPNDLGTRRHVCLETLFPLSSELKGAALVRAMKEDGNNAAAFECRVLAYAELKRNECKDLENLAMVPVVPWEGMLVAPSSLALRGKEDYWGDWKKKVRANLSAKVQDAYRKIGVISSKPTPEHSRAFFTWLARQTPEVLTRHRGCVLRHFHCESGVPSWWNSFPVPCVLVEQGGVTKIIHLAEAKSSQQPAYIPDFPELSEQVAANKTSRLRILVVGHPQVGKPLDDLYRRHGFLSLRMKAGDPQVSVVEELEDITSDCGEIFHALHSPSFRMNLLKSLSKLDLDHKWLRDDWQHRVDTASRVKIARAIQLTYVLAGETYCVSTDIAFDASSRSLWVTSAKESHTQLQHAIADCLFISGAPRYTRSVISELLIATDHDPFKLEAPDSEDEEEPVEDELRLAETFKTHQRLPLPSAPRPVPMSRTPSERRLNGTRTKPEPSSLRGSVEIERLHVQELKESQYAWHCQLCLAECDSSRLAAKSSYAEHTINRQRMIEAHHADQVHPGGARHGGNLVLLCRRHHELVGDSLTREVITTALRDAFTARELEFEVSDAERALVAGVTISITLPDHADPITFFFTNEHRDLWLALADDVKAAD